MNGKIKAVLLLIAMYGFGLASGIAWQNYHYHHMGPPHAIFAEHRIKRLVSELNLSPEQEKDVRAIFQKAHERATQVNEEVSWDLADIHRDSVQAIRKVLTPQQALVFEKWHKKFHDRHKHISDDESDEAPASPHSPS